MQFRTAFLLLCLLLPPFLGVGAASDPPRGPRYETAVEPLLARFCFECHGPNRQESDLRLDTGDFAEDEHIVGNGEGTGELLRRLRSQGDDVMPPADAAWQPTDEQRAVIERWIESGAQWQPHWSDRAIQRPAVPDPVFEVPAEAPIDRFIDYRVHQNGLEPAAPADRHRLARRLALVLTGLPPSDTDLQRFLDDDSPAAVSRFVDRLLAAPAYGEHLGAWWLDQARYADSNGFERDRPREMWYYRDWLIDALNDDMPLNQLTIESLAGDLLENPTTSQLIATGFHRNSMIHDEGGVKENEFKVRTIKDRAETTAAVWLAATMQCAQCHDHMHDPFSQAEYYSLYAFFANTTDRSVSSDDVIFDQSNYDAVEVYLGDPAERERIRQQLADVQSQLEEQPSDEPRPQVRTPWLWGAGAGCVLGILLLTRRRTRPLGIGVAALSLLAVGGIYLAGGRASESGQLRAVERGILERQSDALQKELDELNFRYRVYPMVMNEGPAQEVKIQERGDLYRPGDVVEPTIPAVFKLPLEGPPNRLGLAQWLVDPRNPRTGRVFANRLWARVWGRHIVATDDDFGYRGDVPSHPDLLDYVASDLIHGGWSMKRVLREIVTSRAYQQSSAAEADAYRVDPGNQWFARGPRFRMPAEAIRDYMLAAGGLLERRVGGAPAYPYQPESVWEEVFIGMDNVMLSEWLQFDGWPRYRRGVYTYVRRAAPHPVRAAFDAPIRRTCTTSRPQTNTAAQALVVLNEPTCVEAAFSMAVSLLQKEMSEAERLTTAFERAVHRPADARELERLQQLLHTARSTYRADPEQATELCRHVPTVRRTAADELDPVELASWYAVVNTLLNLDATLTVN